ncbi:MAG: J domain-containing protein [Pseudanabaenaceae cyanobacterium]
MNGFYRWLRWQLEAWYLERRFRQQLQVLTAQPERTLVDVLGTELRILHLPLDRLPTRDELNAAYRQRCKATHPDRGGNTAAFQEVCTAYQTLKDFLVNEAKA